MKDMSKISNKIAKLPYKEKNLGITGQMNDYQKLESMFLDILKQHKIDKKKDHWEYLMCKSHFLYMYNSILNLHLCFIEYDKE